MGLFDEGSGSNLEDVLGQQAVHASNDLTNQFAKARKKLVGQQAHSGRLTSGVSNYAFGDLAAQEAGAQGDIQSGLAGALGQIPATDYLGEQDFNRNLELAKYIASLRKPSALQEALGGLGTATQIVGAGASLAAL